VCADVAVEILLYFKIALAGGAESVVILVAFLKMPKTLLGVYVRRALHIGRI
jgi:hypothetical protein